MDPWAQPVNAVSKEQQVISADKEIRVQPENAAKSAQRVALDLSAKGFLFLLLQTRH
jgi:hypothetical protein